ncbi:MAG: tautomerase family protein [Dehalococcoidales bacterium]|nr:tautomerase family protein [Dehalococcoidales bacterium]
MPLVTINLIEGRSIEQKRGMAKDVTDAIVKNIGCPDAAVQVIITKLKEENIAQGGKLFSDGR